MRSPFSVPKVTVIRRPDRSGYWVHWRDAAGRHRIRRDTARAAEALAQQVRRDLESGDSVRPDALWLVVVREFFGSISHRSRGHLIELHATLDRLTAAARPQYIGDVTATAIETYLAGRRGDVSESTVAKDWRNLRAFLNWTVDRKYLRTNPLDVVPEPKPPMPDPKAPEAAEWVRLLEAIPRVALDDPQGWHLLVLLAAYTGIRETALLRIGLGDVDLGSGETGNVGLLKVTDKGRVVDYKGLPVEITNRVAARINALPVGSTSLFVWTRFQRKAWERLTNAAGFRFTFHDLRRGAILPTLEAAAIAAAREQLGHSDERVTRRNYVAWVQHQRALARAAKLPPLPPLPAFALFSVRPNAPPRPRQT